MTIDRTWPILFKKTSTGAQQQWSIATEDSVIVTRWGQTGGAIQEGRDVISKGKNIGKANSTTPIQQAQAEAQSQWEKKLKKGYVENPDAAMEGKVDTIIAGGIFPMLAHKFSEHGHKISYPAYVQPKLDGHRALAVIADGKCTLWSRTRKRITGVPHIERALERAYADRDFILDGELYVHSYKNNFEELTSFIRQETPKPGHEVVEYHVYDMPSAVGGFGARFAAMNAELVHNYGPVIKQVCTDLVASEDEMMEAFDKFVADGYEGAIVRQADGLYVNKRSYDLLKVKSMDDSEFLVVGVEQGRGKLAGHAIFVCQGSEQFRVKLKGDTAQLKQYWEHPELVVGKQLTVKYQGLTKTGIPRFPIGTRIREDF